MSLHTHASQEFERRFGTAPPLIVRAPGRVNLIGEHFDVPALRDISVEQSEARMGAERGSDRLDEVTGRRARHVATENSRTTQAAEEMERGDAAVLGRLMNASHVSLRDDFEVSSDELDAIVSCAQAQESCFGGCAVAPVRADAAPSFATAVLSGYRVMTGRESSIYVCKTADGAEVEI